MQTTPSKPSKLRRRIALTTAILVVLFLFLFGRGILGSWCGSMGAHRLSIWAISDAQWWLEWSSRLDPKDGQADLMRAACSRHLGQKERWAKAMQSAERKGVPVERLQQESRVALIQSGQVNAGAEHEMAALIEAGVPQQDAVAAFVHGCLARDETKRAKRVLDAWTADAPAGAHNAYVWGVYWSHLNETSNAMSAFEDAVAKEPCHELAWTAIAVLHEKQFRLDKALETFVESGVRFPESEDVRLGLARVLRRLARADEARNVLAPCASLAEPSSAVSIEMGQIQLECGNYQKAERWFGRAHPAVLTPDDVVAVGTTVALAEKPKRAGRLFALVTDNTFASIVSSDLQIRLLLDPNAREAAAELERMARASAGKSDLADTLEMDVSESGESARTSISAADLYARHCGACHGANGDGNGRAARYMFPKPRDLRSDKFRLVSASNAVPTQEDVDAAINRGMPGTSMPSFEDLSQDAKRLLTKEVLRLRREGIREDYVAMLKEEGEEIDEQEVESVVEHLTTPTDVVQVPRFGSANTKTMEMGKDLYFSQTCDSCHGQDGCGDPNLVLFDDGRRPTRARDLVRERFRGGDEPEAIYLRILLGMPGTPHPASKNLTREQSIALVQYCRSLGREPKRTLTNHQRAMQATGHAYLSALTDLPARGPRDSLHER